jgi:hypothetical protein
MRFSDRHRWSGAGAGLALALLLAAGCRDDAAQLDLRLDWPDPPPPGDAFYVALRVEERPDLFVSGRTVAEAELQPIEPGQRVQLPGIPNGPHRVVVVEIYDGPTVRDALILYGISEPFELRPGASGSLALVLPLTAPPIHASGFTVVPSASAPRPGESTLVDRPQVQLLLTTDSAVAADVSNDPGFRAGIGTERVDLSASEGAVANVCPPPAGTRRLCTYRIDWNLDLGVEPPCEATDRCPRRVFARAIDAFGYASASAFVDANVDSLAPSILPDSAGVQIAAPTGSFVLEPEAVTAGSRLQVSFSVSEPLAEPPGLRIEGLDDARVELRSAVGLTYGFQVRVPDSVAGAREGPLSLRVHLVDRVGRQAEPALPIQPLLDLSAPPPPTTMGAAALVFHRIPHGRDPAFGPASHTLEVPPGAVEPGALISVEASGIGEVARSGRGIASGGSLSLATPDTPTLLVRSVDRAGNISRTATVTDVRWTVSMRTKIPNRPAPNPHRLLTARGQRGSLWQQRTTDGVEPGRQGLADVAAWDGSSLVLTSEPAWVRTETDAIGPTNIGIQPIYDPVQGRMIHFEDLGTVGAIHAWDGFTWSTRITPGRPERLTLAKPISFDPFQQTWVSDDASSLGFTYRFDGADWLPIAESPIAEGSRGPRSFDNAAGGFDQRRRTHLLFGGTGDLEEINDQGLLVFDGTWREVRGDFDPDPRTGALLVYDPMEELTLLFGGAAANFNPADGTWAWDGQTWTRRSSANAALFNQSAVGYFDPESGQVVGRTPTSELRWTGAEWTATTIAPPPTTLIWVGIGRDAGRSVDFLINCVGATRPCPDEGQTWEFVDGRWLRVAPVSLDRDLSGTAFAAYDRARQRAIFIDGEGLGVQEWDAELVAESSGFGPGPRSAPAVADADGSGILLFGGSVLNSPSQPLGDTWTWDGVGWTAGSPAHAPSPRSASAMTYDERTGKTVLFGGFDGQRQLTDTWEWDGSDWTQTSSAGPGDEETTLLLAAFDPDARTVVLLEFPSGTLWTYDGTGWQPSPTPETLPDFAFGWLAFDEKRGRLVLVGQTDLGSLARTFVLIGNRWVELSNEAPALANREALSIFDRNSERLTFLGRSVQVLAGSDGPSMVMDIDTSFIAIDGLRVALVAGAVGKDRPGPQRPSLPGAQLDGWDVRFSRWVPLAVNDAPPDAPARMEVDVPDPRNLAVDDHIYLRVRPRGVDYGDTQARLALDYWEATVVTQPE